MINWGDYPASKGCPLVKKLRALGVLLSAVALTLMGTTAATAAPRDYIYYVSAQGNGLGVYMAQIDSVSGDFASNLAVAITADTAAGHSSASLATDGTYLYFADNESNGTWDLVRTDLNGDNRTLLTSGVDDPLYIRPMGASVYYTTDTGGLFWTPSGGLNPNPPTEVFGPNATAGFGGMPNNGFGPFEFFNGKIYLDVNTVGLLAADWSFNNPTNGEMLTPAGYADMSVTDIAVHDDELWFSGWYTSGVLHTADPATDTNTWTYIDTSVPINNSDRVYRMGFTADRMYFTTSFGEFISYDFAAPSVGERDITAGVLTNNQDFVLVTWDPDAEPVDDGEPEVTELASTGFDATVGFTALALVGLGAGLASRRRSRS